MFWSSPACSARIGASISLARAVGPGDAVPLPRVAVEADRAPQPVAGRRREPGVPAAEAEADGEDRRATEAAQMIDRRGDVGLDLLRLRLVDVRPVLEVVAALGDACGTAE